MPDLRDRAARLRAALPDRQRQRPPEERGKRLATLPRNDRGQPAELRITWDEYEGHPYLSLRLWRADDNGDFWPTKTGATVRLRELPEVAEALASALDLAEQHTRTRAGPESRHRSGPPAGRQGGNDHGF